MTIATALVQGQKLLGDAGISVPRLTAEVLLCHAIGCERSWLFAHSNDELKEVWWIHYGRYLHQRLNGMPTQYITGHQEFFGHDFLVTRDVLIPRPETEHLIEAVLRLGAQSILDVGAGSGAIAVTLALETKARVIATDISVEALKVAKHNAIRLGAKVDFLACDLASAITDRSFDLLVSNPPYVPESEELPTEVREHEPALALFGGADGLAIYARLIPEATRILKPGGTLIVELGAGLAQQVSTMLGPELSVAEIIPDLAGIPRVLQATLRS